MNLIEKLGLEKCKQIVDGAPEGAMQINQTPNYFKNIKHPYCEMWNPYDQKWFETEVFSFDVFSNIADLKAQIDQHYYGQSEEKELEQYALLSQEKIEGGAMLVGDFSKVRERIQSVFEDDRTDYVSDIRNHISPTTKVIER